MQVTGIVAQTAETDACREQPGWICEQVFRLTGGETLALLAGQILGPAVRIGAIVLLAIVATRLLKRVINRVVGRMVARADSDVRGDAAAQRSATRSRTLAGMLSALATMTVWTLALLTILGEIGFNLGPLIAGLGIVGVALGFGAQHLVSDFVSGLFMLAEDQFGVGDIVEIDGTSGTVEHVGLRTTRLRAVDGRVWTLRNGEISRTANANKGWTRVVLDVGVAYGSDLRKAAATIKAAAEEARRDPELEGKFLGDPELWGVQDLGADAVSIRLVCKTAPGAHYSLGRELRLRIKEALDREGVEIPFPQRTVWLRTEPETLVAPIPFARVVADGTEHDKG